MKTGPAAPALPLWMCAAFPAPSIFEILNSQQTLPVAGLSVISTEPLFEAGDFGTSFAPLSWAFRWLPPLAAAIAANMTPVAMAVTSTAIANLPFRINPPLAWFRPVVRREGGFGFPTLDARCGSSIGSESQRGSAPGRRLPPPAGSPPPAPGGLGAALAAAGWLARSRAGAIAAIVIGMVVGVLVGFALDNWDEALAGAIGGLLGGLGGTTLAAGT